MGIQNDSFISNFDHCVFDMIKLSVIIITICFISPHIIDNEIYANDEKSISIQYPPNYAGIQRIDESHGDIIIQGIYSGSPSSIEAQFNSEEWEIIDQNPFDGKFSGKLFNQKIGQGDLIVRFTNDSRINNTANHISIGDVFVIAGQSNALGQANYTQRLDKENEFITTIFYGNFPIIKNSGLEITLISNGTIMKKSVDGFFKTNEWFEGPYEDHSPFPLVSNIIMQKENVPISFIQTSTNGGGIELWQKDTNNTYEKMIHYITKATNGNMNIKAILFFQGESDTYLDHFNTYDNYKNNVQTLVQNLFNDTNTEKFILGQIGETPERHSKIATSKIQKAQQDLWSSENILSGPITYDIGPLSDNLHFITDEEIRELSNRWGISILRGVYEHDIPTNPELVDSTIENHRINKKIIQKKITLVFDKKINLENWMKEEGSAMKGLYIKDGIEEFDHTDFQIKIIDNKVILRTNQNISNYASMSYPIGSESAGEYSIRETSNNSLPMKPIYQVILHHNST